MFRKILICLLLFASCIASADTTTYPTALINVGARDAIDLSGQWHYIVDPLKTGIVRADSRRYSVFRDFAGPENPVDFFEYNFDAAPRMSIPGDWNGQDVSLTWYDGLVWFRRTLDLGELPDERQVLHFGAANYKSLVYVNGEKAGEHEGGFTPFAFDITDLLVAGRNSIVVGVDAEHAAASVPTPVVDWKNFGGITRPVHLVSLPDTYVHDYFVRLEPDDRLGAEVRLGGDDVSNRDVSIEIPELKLALRGKTDKSGKALIEVDVPADLQRWSPDSPVLYDVSIAGAGDSVADRIGFRTVAVDGNEILLNGKPIFLRGISIHEEALGAIPSRAINEARARALLSIARDDLNANFVRLAHYPHAAVMTRVADEMGLLVWSEIPVYWDIDFGNADTLALAKRMQEENIVRDRNRASIIFWSIANETPQTDARLAFLGELIDDARRLDGTRLITAAMHQARNKGGVMVIDDPLGELIDVVSVNTYQGWYGSRPLSQVGGLEWSNPTGKPFLFSEFGAGALFGFRDAGLEKFSEDFQAAYYRETLKMAEQIDDLSGMSPWILKDFLSPRRMNWKYQQYWNRKGIISPEGHRKAAFSVLADWYDEIAAEGVDQ